MHRDRTPHGYTIIELTIVVLIIALLLGAVLSGASLLRDAQMRTTISDLDTFQKALHLFYDKYNEMPGDMVDARTFWGTDPGGCPAAWNPTPKKGTCNGDGDGKISPQNFDSGTYTDFQESFRAWQQLNDAGFTPALMTGMPGPSGSGKDAQIGFNVPHGYSTDVGYMLYYLQCYTCAASPGSYYPGKYGHIFEVGQRGTAPNDYAHAPFLSTTEALSIDSKIDDGRPGYGKVVVPPTEATCVTSNAQATAVYNTNNTASSLCSLIYITGL